MVKKYLCLSYSSPQRGYDKHFSGFQGYRDHSTAQFGQIVFVGSADLFNQAMGTKSFEHSRDLMSLLVTQMFSDASITESTDIKFTTKDRLEQIQVIAMKEIESAVAASLLLGRTRYFFNHFLSRTRVIDRRDKINITVISRRKKISQYGQRIDAFTQRGQLNRGGSVAMFHLPVVFKKGNIVNRGLDTQHQAVLVVHLDGHRSHVMFDTRSHDACAEVVAYFVLIIAIEFTTQKSGDVIRFNRMNRGAYQFLVNQLQVTLLTENDIGSVFHLHETPVIAVFKMTDNRTVAFGHLIQRPMKLLDIDMVSQFLSLGKVLDFYESVIDQRVANIFLVEPGGQLVMTIEIELQPKRRPGWHPQITQTQSGVDKVKVVVQAFGFMVLEKRLMGFFIVPGLVAGAGFHGRENMDQTGMTAALSHDFFDALLFAKVLLANEVDFQTIFHRDPFGILSDFLSQRLGPFDVVENANTLLAQKQTHALGVTNARQGSRQDGPVKAGEYPLNLTGVTFDQ